MMRGLDVGPTQLLCPGQSRHSLPRHSPLSPQYPLYSGLVWRLRGCYPDIVKTIRGYCMTVFTYSRSSNSGSRPCNSGRSRGLSAFTMLVCATSIGSTSHGFAQNVSTIDGQDLRIVEVSAPQINCVFDRDCRITVSDFTEQFSLPFAQGTGFLQSRQFPVGEAGTKAEGLYPYLYRVDLSQMHNESEKRCIKTISFDFPAPVALPYSAKRKDKLGHVFVVTKNALGGVKPTRAVLDGKTVQLHFKDLCTAGPNDNQGRDSFFFGMASKSAPATTKARLTDHDGRAIEVLARSASTPSAGGVRYEQPNVTTNRAQITPPPRTTTPGGLPIATPLPKTYEGQTDSQPSATPAPSPRPTALVEERKADIIIGFEEHRANRNGITIDDQYREKFGVRFLPGVSVHRCGGESTRAMACTYVRAADGTRTAYFDGRSNSGTMIMDFARPVQEVSMRVNPTGAKPNETFTLEMKAFQDQREVVASSSEAITWNFNRATNWPYTGRISVNHPEGATRLAVVMRASQQNNQSIRFLFDEIKISYAQAGADDSDDPLTKDSPAGAAIYSTDQARADANLGPAENVGWPAQRIEKKSPFKAAPRLRARINWPAAQAALAEQNRLGLSPARLARPASLDEAALPVLLPAFADQAIDLAVTRDGNSYSAIFTHGGRQYDYYGSRMLTRMTNKVAGTHSAGPVRYIEGETGLSASFTLYGAVYRVTQTCKQESPRLDPDCFDTQRLEEKLRELMIALGRRAGGRP